MKIKLIIIIVALIFLRFSLVSWASTTPTPSQKPTPTGNLDQQMNALKERIASRVAQLKLVEKRGSIGTVSDLSETQITTTDNAGNINYIDVDELTKFSSPDVKGSFGISDIAKGQ